jgi:hypothetical protein
MACVSQLMSLLLVDMQFKRHFFSSMTSTHKQWGIVVLPTILIGVDGICVF